jgi:ketosteroid isomerase-like protein
MKTGTSIAAFMVAIVSLVFAQAEKTSPAAEEVRRANAEEVAAMLKSDDAALAPMWSDEFVVTNPFNKFLNKQRVLGMVKAGMIAFSAYDRQLEYVHVYPDSVVVARSETVVWAGKMPTAGQTNQLRFTAIWMKKDGRWQTVPHASIVVQR